MEAIKSLRRRWRAVRLHLLQAESQRQASPITFRYAMEIAFDAVELCIAHNKQEWAEMALGECLLLKELRFRTMDRLEASDVVDNASSHSSVDRDITALKKRVLLRHCEILLYLHDVAPQTSIEECRLWLDRRRKHEEFLELQLLESSRGGDAFDADRLSVDGFADGSVVEDASLSAPPSGGPSGDRLNDQSEERALPPAAPTVSFAVDGSLDQQQAQHSQSVFSASAAHPTATAYVEQQYRSALLVVCISNAYEAMRAHEANEARLAILQEAVTLAPVLEILAEAHDRYVLYIYICVCVCLCVRPL
jgi:hypothetical protein